MHDSPLEILPTVRALSESGEPRAALELLRTIDLASIESPPEIVAIGHGYMDLEQFSEALDVFDRAVAQMPGTAAAHSARGQALLAMGRYEDAEAAFARSIALAPTASRWVMRGDVQVALGRDASAEESFREALRIDSDDDEALYNVALLVRERDPLQALALLQRACRIDPLSAEAHRELGFSLLQQGDVESAEHELRTAIKLSPSDPWAFVYMSELEAKTGRNTDARASLEHAHAVSPLWPVPMYLLGLHEERHGSAAGALTFFKGSHDLDGLDVNAAFHLARFLAIAGRVAEAIKVLRPVSKIKGAERARALLDRLVEG